jgi:hypothetical protein
MEGSLGLSRSVSVCCVIHPVILAIMSQLDQLLCLTKLAQHLAPNNLPASTSAHAHALSGYIGSLGPILKLLLLIPISRCCCCVVVSGHECSS